MKQCNDCKKMKPLKQFYKRSDKMSKDGRAYVCSSCNKKRKKEWYGFNKCRPKVRFKCLKSEAKQRNLNLELTLEEFTVFTGKNCYYCDTCMDEHVGSGLDRLNNELGYTVKNVVTCCGPCNTGRSDNFTSEEWKVMITALKEWRKTEVPTLTPLKARTD